MEVRKADTAHGDRLQETKAKTVPTIGNFRASSVHVEDVSDPFIQRLSPDLYCGKAGENLYCAIERVTPERLQVWESFIERGEEAFSKNEVPFVSYEFSLHINHSAFLNTLRSHGNPGEHHWAAYLSRFKVNEPITEGAKGIEMLVGVSLHDEAPFSMHRGIVRSYTCFLEGGPYHRGVSQVLHAFCGRVVHNFLKPDNVYMITTPTPLMKSLMVKAFSDDICQFQGPYSSFKEGEITGTTLQENFRGMPHDQEAWFQLHSPSFNVIFEISEADTFKRHAWFFQNIDNRNGACYAIMDLPKLAESFGEQLAKLKKNT